MNPPTQRTTTQLKRTIGAPGYFTLAFGTVVGSGWIIVLGDWLRSAGPGGAMVGFLAGGAAMIVVGLCYAELTARMPRVGGEFLYARECLGSRAAFVVGWFMTLYMVSIPAFEGIILGVLMQNLMPSLRNSPGYDLLGQHVLLSSVSLGLVGALGMAVLNILGSRIAVTFQNVVTFSFLVIISLAVVIALHNGTASNLSPLFPNSGEIHWVSGAFWIFSTSGMFLNGFQAALHAIEERGEQTSLRKAALSMVAAIGAAAVFYGLIVLAASSAVPWQTLLQAELPAATAFAASIKGGALGTIVIAAATISLLKTWNGMTMMGSRFVFAQARFGYLPQALVKVSGRTGVPTVAIVAVSAVSAALIPLGRGFVVPIVNMVSICLSLSYVMCLWILLRLRASRTIEARSLAFAVPGGRVLVWLGFVSAVLMASIALVEPAVRLHAIPPEWYLMGIWAAVGLLLYVASRRYVRSTASETPYS